MKKLIVVTLLGFAGIALLACDKREDPPPKEASQTEAIETLAPAGKEWKGSLGKFKVELVLPPEFEEQAPTPGAGTITEWKLKGQLIQLDVMEYPGTDARKFAQDYASKVKQMASANDATFKALIDKETKVGDLDAWRVDVVVGGNPAVPVAGNHIFIAGETTTLMFRFMDQASEPDLVSNEKMFDELLRRLKIGK